METNEPQEEPSRDERPPRGVQQYLTLRGDQRRVLEYLQRTDSHTQLQTMERELRNEAFRGNVRRVRELLSMNVRQTMGNFDIRLPGDMVLEHRVTAREELWGKQRLTPLMLAAFRGYDAVVRLLLDYQPSEVNRYAGYVLWPPVFFAVISGNVETVRTLILAKSNVLHRDARGKTLADILVTESELADEQEYIDRSQRARRDQILLMIEYAQEYEQNPHLASSILLHEVRRNNDAMVDFLLELGVRQRIETRRVPIDRKALASPHGVKLSRGSLYMMGRDGNQFETSAPLLFALENRNERMAIRLIYNLYEYHLEDVRRAETPTVVEGLWNILVTRTLVPTNRNHETPIVLACYYMMPSVVHLLLLLGAPASPPVSHPAKSLQEIVTQRLFAYTSGEISEPRFMERANEVLFAMKMAEDIKSTEGLRSTRNLWKEDYEAQLPFAQNTALHALVERNDVEGVQTAIDDAESADRNLPVGFQRVHTNALRIVNSRDEQGRTPLMIALLKEHRALIRMLLRHPLVDISLRDNAGWSAAHYVAMYRLSDVDRVLSMLLSPERTIRFNAIDILASVDKFGYTPRDHAWWLQNTSAVAAFAVAEEAAHRAINEANLLFIDQAQSDGNPVEQQPETIEWPQETASSSAESAAIPDDIDLSILDVLQQGQPSALFDPEFLDIM